MLYALSVMLAFGVWTSLISPDIDSGISWVRRFSAFGVWLCVMFFMAFPIAMNATWIMIFASYIVGLALIPVYAKIITGRV